MKFTCVYEYISTSRARGSSQAHRMTDYVGRYDVFLVIPRIVYCGGRARVRSLARSLARYTYIRITANAAHVPRCLPPPPPQQRRLVQSRESRGEIPSRVSASLALSQHVRERTSGRAMRNSCARGVSRIRVISALLRKSERERERERGRLFFSFLQNNAQCGIDTARAGSQLSSE